MSTEAFGSLLRRWREGLRLTQEQLADDAEVSTRHLSCLERGKSRPSREMVLVLASVLELELRDRNVLLGCAGFAPVYPSSALESLAMAPIRRAIDLVLKQQEPYGAVVVDRAWNLLEMNDGAARMIAALLPTPPEDPRIASNVLRILMHPTGLRPCIVNWVEVAAFTLERIDRDCDLHPHDELRSALRDELLTYPGVAALRPAGTPRANDPVATIHLRHGDTEVRLFTMLTTLGTPMDVTAQELAIESYFPADADSERWLRGLAAPL
jgi:transcriptional regulator with XRE-family HTH domain